MSIAVPGIETPQQTVFVQNGRNCWEKKGRKAQSSTSLSNVFDIIVEVSCPPRLSGRTNEWPFKKGNVILNGAERSEESGSMNLILRPARGTSELRMTFGYGIPFTSRPIS